jgi:dihydrofolate synthase/folylpolyglutamate synthase
VANALVAVRLLEALDEAGIAVPGDAVEAGLRDARWPGRLELLRLPDGRTALLDAAHNPAGAVTLAAYLREVRPGGVTLVFGAVREKDHAGMLRALLPSVRHLVLTAPATPRAATPEELAAVAMRLRPGRAVTCEPDPIAALARAWSHGQDIVVAGSIFLIGTVRPALIASARG